MSKIFRNSIFTAAWFLGAITVVWSQTEEQEIFFNPAPELEYGGAPFSLDGHATASSGLPVEYSVLAGPGHLNDANELIATGPGYITLMMFQAGDADYFSAITRQVIYVSAADLDPGPGYLDLWTWRHPQLPSELELRGVSSSSTAVVAVGSNGLIKRSLDGEIWEVSSVPVGSQNTKVYSIAYDGSDMFVTVGSGGAILSSTDDGLTWTSSTSGVGTDLRGVAFGGGEFAAVGADGTILTSPDGVNWNPMVNPITNRDLYAVIYRGGGLDRFIAVGEAGTILTFQVGGSVTVIQSGLAYSLHDVVVTERGGLVAVGENGHILTSSNGSVWNVKFSGTAYTLYAVYSANGYTVALGEDGRVVMTQDENLWTERTSRFPYDVFDVGFLKGRFIAVGEHQTIFSSPSGHAWTQWDSASPWVIRGSAFGNEMFVVVGDDGKILFSSDGIEWQAPNADLPVSEDLFAVTYGDGFFVAVGGDGTVLRADEEDLSSWTTATDSSVTVDLLAVAFDDGLFVATGTENTIITSSDGDLWQRRVFGSASSVAINGIAFGGNRFVAVGDNGTVYTSDRETEGTVWVHRPTPIAADLQSITYGQEKFVAVGGDGTVLTSRFGAVWTKELSGVEDALESVYFSQEDGLFLAVGEHFGFLTSQDAIRWQQQRSGNNNSLRTVISGNGTYVAAGDFASLLTSERAQPSGLDRWTLRGPAPDSDDLWDVVYANDLYVAVGENGLIITSTDGENWVAQASGVTETITGIAYGNERWVAVAGQNVLTSENGTTWQSTLTWTVPMERIAFADGLFVSVGANSHIFSSPDGIVWSGGGRSPVFDTADLHGIHYYEPFGRWVAVGEPTVRPSVFFGQDKLQSQIFTSENGVDWVIHEMPVVDEENHFNAPLFSVASAPNGSGLPYVVALGAGALFSLDGLDWTINWIGGVEIYGAVYGPGNGTARLAMVGQNGSIHSYQPGDISFPGIFDDLRAVAWGNKQFIAVGDNGRILTSSDGVFWQTRSADEREPFLDIARGGANFVAIGAGGRIYSSTSGATWDLRTPPAGGAQTMRGLVWADTGFIAVGNNGAVWTSSTGISWQNRVSGTLSDLNDVAHDGQRIVAVGNDNTIIVSNSAGSEWIVISPQVTDTDLLSLIYHPETARFVAVGLDGSVIVSTDGETWALAADLGSLPLHAITRLSDGNLVIVGEEGQIFISEDGANWESMFSGTTHSLYTVTEGDGIIFVAGEDGLGLSSSDGGRTWFRRSTNTAYDLYGSVFYEGNFFAVGGFGTIISSGEIIEKLDQVLTFVTIGDRSVQDSPITLHASASSGLVPVFEVVAGPATIVGNQLTLTSHGDVRVRVTQPGNRLYSPATPLEQTISVSAAPRMPQTITFPDLINRSFNVEFDLNATASSGLPVTYEIVEGPAILTGPTSVRTKSTEGSVTIRASQSGDATWMSAPSVDQSFDVRTLDHQTVTFDAIPQVVIGDSAVTLLATASSGLPISEYRVLNGPAKAIGDQLYVFGIGIVTLRAYQDGGGIFQPAVATISFAVGGPPPEIGPGFLDLWSWRSPNAEGTAGYNAFAVGTDQVLAVGDGGRVALNVAGSTDWQTVANIGGLDLRGALFDGQQFVVVGENGLISTSADGIGWTTQTSGVTASLTGVAFDPILGYAVVGEDGTLLHSTNAINWSIVAAPIGFADDLNAVVALSLPVQRFIAVGNRGAIVTSTDGVGWDVRLSGLAFGLHDVHVVEQPKNGWRAFAVGDRGIVLASEDGQSWSTRHSQTAYDLHSVYSGNGFVLAVGDDGRVLQTRDGNVWTNSVTRFPGNMRSLTYSKGLFYAGGDLYSIFSTPEGLSWTLRETETRITYRGSAGNSTLRVVVGDDGTIRRSTDNGMSWQAAVSVPTAADLNGITLGPDGFVVVGDEGTILISGDGDTWLEIESITTENLRFVHYANERYVAVGDRYTILTSSDGTNWNRVTTGGVALTAVTYGGNTWVVTGEKGTVLVSVDGVDWEPVPTPTNANLSGITYSQSSGSGKFVTVGDNGVILTSQFGNVWTSRFSGTELDLYSIARADGVFVAVGEGFTFATSRDGENWETLHSATRNSLRSVSFVDDVFLAVGDYETILSADSVLSPGLDRWTLRNPKPEGPELHDVIYAKDTYVAIGENGTVLVSTDGQSWTTRDVAIDDPITGIAYGNGRFVAVGGHHILTSTDTHTWTVQETWDVHPLLHKVTFARNVFVAVGDDSTILYSVDGIEWAGHQETLDAQPLYNVSYSQELDEFIAVGAPSLRPVPLEMVFLGQTYRWAYEQSVTQIYRSQDGINWEIEEPPLLVTPVRIVYDLEGNPWPDPEPVWISDTLRGVTFGNDRFQASGNGIEIMSKVADEIRQEDEPSDGVKGVKWMIRGWSGVNINDIAYGPARGDARIVYVGDGGTVFSRDPDGISFPGISENLNAVTWAKDEFIAVGSNASILTSPDGRFWQTRSSEAVEAFLSIAWRAGRYVVVGEGGKAYYSDNGINWNSSGTGTLLNINSVTTGLGQFVAVGNSGLVLRSGDGNGWTASAAGTSVNLRGIATDGQRLVTVGDLGVVLVSSNGETWTQTNVDVGDLYGVHYSAEHEAFFAVGASGNILESADGFQWTIHDAGVTLPLFAIGEGTDGQLIAVGEAGIIRTSTDGQNWESSFSGTKSSLRTVVSGEGILFVTGDNGTALSSSDGGRSWFRRHTNTGYTLHDVHFQDGSFIAVGGFGTIITSENVERRFNQTIQFASIPDTVSSNDDPIHLDAIATSGLPVVFTLVEGPAVINGNIITLKGEVGTVTVRAQQPGNANFRPAPPVERTFAVRLSLQEINFAKPQNKIFGTEPFVLQATATSGLPVLLTVVSGPATVYEGVVTLTGAGTVTIKAEQLGNTEFNAASPVVHTFEVAKASQEIAFVVSGNHAFGDPPLGLEAFATSNLPVSFRVVSGPGRIMNGALEFTGAGVIAVEASQDGDENYLPAPSVVRSILVSSAQLGSIWTRQTTGTTADLLTIIYADQKFVVAGATQTVLTSHSGSQWNQRASGGAELLALTHGAGRFVAGGALGPRIASPNGTSWNALPASLDEPINTLSYGAGVFVAGGNEGFIATSPDLANWTVRESGVLADSADIVFTGAEFYAVAGGTVLKSQLGQHWETVLNVGGSEFNGITVGDGRIVVVGPDSTIWMSSDGIDWATGFISAETSLNAVAYGAGRFVAVGDGGVVLSSIDGQSWIIRDSTVTENLHDVAFANDVFVVVGAKGSVITSGSIRSRTDQMIQFNPIADRLLSDGPLTISATATSGLPVSFAVASGPARLEVTETGARLVFFGMGPVVVRATQQGNDLFHAAPEITHTFQVSGPAPTIDIVNPVGDSFFLLGDPITVEARVTIPEGGELRKVQLMINDQLVEMTRESATRFSWTFTPEMEGEYVLQTSVEDIQGIVSLSQPVSAVVVDSTIPTITLFASNAVFNRAFVNEVITFTIEASDETGIASVELFRNGHLIQQDENDPYSFSVSHNTSGSFNYWIRVVNNDGLYVNSESIAIQVRYPNVSESDSDFVYSVYQDLFGRRPTVEERNIGISSVADRGRAKFVEALLDSDELQEKISILKARYFLTDAWGNADLLNSDLAFVEQHHFPALVSDLYPEFVEIFLGGEDPPAPILPDPKQSTQEARDNVNEYLTILWHRKYGDDAPGPTEEQLLQFRDTYWKNRTVNSEQFLSNVMIEDLIINNKSFVLDVENPPPDLLSKRAKAAAIWIQLLRVEPTNEDLDNLPSDMLEMIESIVTGSQYLNRFSTTLQNSIHVHGNYWWSIWLGWYNDLYYPWVYSWDLGWVYLVGQSPESVWLFSFDHGWLWTSDNYFLNYRTFFKYATSAWMQWD